MRLNLIRRGMTRRANHQTAIFNLGQAWDEAGSRQVRYQAAQEGADATECCKTGKRDSTGGLGATRIRFFAVDGEVVDADEKEGLREDPVERCAYDDEWNGPFVGKLQEVCASLFAVGFCDA
jgi:hypothetical protein